MFGIKRKKYKLKTDEELVNLYKTEQSSLCISILYERYSHLVMGVCLKYLKNEVEAQDITMQLFEDLHSKILKHNIQFFKSWLYMVVKNECFMFLRKTKREISIEYIDGNIQEESTDYHESKEVYYQLLEKAIDSLKLEQKQCVTLFYLEEKSYHQISLELNIPLLKVKSAIQNGKRNIKIQLEEQNEFKQDK